MAIDANFLLILSASILLLAFLTWLMYKEGSKHSWKEISKNTKEERNRMEKN
ncbi:MAG: hypothetical protein ABIH83_00335 [Candidatus Micrarchaeota archaeon]